MSTSIIGKSDRVYDMLNRKRPLTLAMIRRLHHSLGIPANVLIAQKVVTQGQRDGHALRSAHKITCLYPD